MTSLARVVIAAPSTGQGKTTVATGLMAAMRAAGHQVSGHKIGPDYIDPGYHALATRRPGRNLDPHLVGPDRIAPLLLHGAAGADVAVIEGVMGLFDGKLGTDGFASTAHVAKLTASPVILVLDVARMSRTAAAIAAGMATFDSKLDLAGVVLNRAGSQRNDHEIATAIEGIGLPVVGLVPRDQQLATPSRHLGLITADEHTESAAMVDRLGAHIAQHADLSAVRDIAAAAPELDAAAWNPGDEVQPPGFARPVVAMASGAAFTFRYTETAELLTAAGCHLVDFDPLTDTALPTGTRGIYLGGGFPEEHAAALARNHALLADLRAKVTAGVPTVAECAGLLYLAQSLDDLAMAQVIDTTAAMTDRLTLRYPVAVAAADSLLTRAGEQITGHEFHHTSTDPASDADTPAWMIDGEPTGFGTPSLHASYLHVHWAGHPQLAQRFADAVHGSTDVGDGTDLDHHGDAEVGDNLLDFAVNVYSGPRPGWLDEALTAAVVDSASYPDASAATETLAELHECQPDQVLPTAGGAEAFALVATMRRWRKPVVIHPQFTEPHAALLRAGHQVTTVLGRAEDDFALPFDEVPADADLVVVGNPTNPTGVLHSAAAIRKLRSPGRVVVVDEAFMDAVPGEPESVIGDDVIVLRSLTKHWSIPGIRAGYVIAPPALIAEAAAQQTPWSVSTPAIAAMVACSSSPARQLSRERAETMATWRAELATGLADYGVRVIESQAPFVLAQLGLGVRDRLRVRGIAVRRADTFPGLDATWVRIAARPPEVTAKLLAEVAHQ